MAEVHKFAFDLPVLDINMSLLTNAKPLIAGKIEILSNVPPYESSLLRNDCYGT